jgi:hypothetical protein
MISGAKIPSHVAGETVDGETIVINLLSGAYHSVRGDAASVWASIVATSAHESNERTNQVLADFRAAGIIEWTGSHDLPSPSTDPSANGLTSYTDMAQLLLADPIHEVDEAGWPKLREDPS